jgi:hypothetical protein
VQSHPSDLAIATTGFGLIDQNDQLALAASLVVGNGSNQPIDDLVKVI